MSALNKLRVQTPRLVVTGLSMTMAEEIQRQSQDEATRRFLPDEVFDTMEEAQETVRELIEAYQSPDGPYVYAVVRRDEVLLGYVQLCRIDDGWEIGYHIAEEHRGQGYASESVKAFLSAVMERLGVSQVWGVVDERNAASCRVLEKCGFRLVERGEGLYHGALRLRRRYLYQL